MVYYFIYSTINCAVIAFSKVKSNDPEWFFFSPVGLKLTKDRRNRCNRLRKPKLGSGSQLVKTVRSEAPTMSLALRRLWFFTRVVVLMLSRPIGSFMNIMQ